MLSGRRVIIDEKKHRVIKIDPDSNYQIYSINKLITCIAYAISYSKGDQQYVLLLHAGSGILTSANRGTLAKELKNAEIDGVVATANSDDIETQKMFNEMTNYLQQYGAPQIETTQGGSYEVDNWGNQAVALNIKNILAKNDLVAINQYLSRLNDAIVSTQFQRKNWLGKVVDAMPDGVKEICKVLREYNSLPNKNIYSSIKGIFDRVVAILDASNRKHNSRRQLGTQAFYHDQLQYARTVLERVKADVDSRRAPVVSITIT